MADCKFDVILLNSERKVKNGSSTSCYKSPDESWTKTWFINVEEDVKDFVCARHGCENKATEGSNVEIADYSDDYQFIIPLCHTCSTGSEWQDGWFPVKKGTKAARVPLSACVKENEKVEELVSAKVRVESISARGGIGKKKWLSCTNENELPECAAEGCKNLATDISHVYVESERFGKNRYYFFIPLCDKCKMRSGTDLFPVVDGTKAVRRLDVEEKETKKDSSR